RTGARSAARRVSRLQPGAGRGRRRRRAREPAAPAAAREDRPRDGLPADRHRQDGGAGGTGGLGMDPRSGGAPSRAGAGRSVMVRLLVSVRDVDEALAAAAAGADFIDCKEPSDGALGALAPERIAQIVAVLRERHPGLRISATIGDLAADSGGEVLRRVERVAACGVDDVKVGVWPAGGALLRALAGCSCSIVPVLLADDGVDPALVERALALDAFVAVMVDTARKGEGSLLQRRPWNELATFVAAVQAR